MEDLHEINITPFTDVLLVLLIIFMILAALTIPPGFERELPNTCHMCSHPATQKAKPIDIIVTSSGAMSIDGAATDDRHIYAMLAAREAVKRHAAVALYGAAGAPYGRIMRVLDAAKEAGITDVNFISQ